VLVDFLSANTDIFVWSPLYMPSILREVAEHSLDTYLTQEPCNNVYNASTKNDAERSE
jgi:hypothetical protein